ncbi:HAD family hydrolase [Bifidobacterium goeldii]|nr:HAD family hydrolase [Bifidobacterium goeldii]
MTPTNTPSVTSTPASRADHIRLVVADLDGTLLHDGATFEERFITQQSIDTIQRVHDAGYRFAIATARPVSTGLAFAQKLPADAVIYLNGALIDFDPTHSDFELLTGAKPAAEGHLVKIGFASTRACEVCRMFLAEMPTLKIGIVMDDVRYTNFDVSVYWKTQTWRYTDFSDSDIPAGLADKITIFPDEAQWKRLETLVPDDFDVHISEGTMWMLMSPQANKEHALRMVCDRFGVSLDQTVTFGDDTIDIAMMQESGCSVAVANANPAVLDIASEICTSNNDDGVARWLEEHLL